MLAVLCAWFDLSPEGRCRSGSETPKVSRVNRASGLGPASVLFPMTEKRPAGGQGVGSRLLVIASGAFEAFKHRAAELQAEAELIGCALTRRGQDEREQPRVLLAAFRVSATLSKRSDRSTATLACVWARGSRRLSYAQQIAK
jgi:hypothetical protein